ncbi:MAG: hypothetical protein E7397_01885 [Ruminococcaceae bacterium]|nr:hypothetical protein [Oscillospiraceae bacterium]
MLYQGDYLNEISFPLGGIGTGCVGLGGNGRLTDWEIITRPNKGGKNGFSHMAVRVKTKDGVYAKVLNSDFQSNLSGVYRKQPFAGFGYGVERETMAGMPHFAENTFLGEFPIAELTFRDEHFPGAVLLRAFNPMIPNDAKNSSIPAAFFEIEYQNPTAEVVEFDGVFSLSSPYEKGVHLVEKNGTITTVRIKNAEKSETEYGYSDLAISAEDVTNLQCYWHKNGGCDAVNLYWNELISGELFKERSYDEPLRESTCSMLRRVSLAPGEKAVIRFVLSWNLPYMKNDWDDVMDSAYREVVWKHYYATVFENATASGVYALSNWDSLYQRTEQFRKALFSSTVDEVVLDAVSATMSVLKSPTVYRLENGELYGFEGVHEQSGSCPGTCQHVYNYAYALCFLFPELERSIRNLEYRYATDENGKMTFRLPLPLGCEGETSGFTPSDKLHACLDGQMGSIIKTYREWKISGDDQWLDSVWSKVEKAMEYAWSPENPHEWDKNRDGVLEGRQHHTLDIELFGASAWLEGLYLGALKAASEMAEYLGHSKKAAEYLSLFEQGRKWTKENLFNGEYFVQKIDLKDRSICEHFDCTDIYWDEECGEICYQFGEGSSIDQLCAQWHASLCGLGDLFDPEQRRTALESMVKYNFKSCLREYANPWRVFALNDEAGTVICDFPKGHKKPKIPVLYFGECMTGFEYQFAGLLMSEGMIEEGLRVVKVIRDRYDGKKRNPWNEIECGSNYARAMASFSMLPILSGFEFDLPRATVGFSPKVNRDMFSCFWSLGTGWGTVEYTKEKVVIHIEEGSLLLGCIRLPGRSKPEKLLVDGTEVSFLWENESLIFVKTEGHKTFEIINV